MTCLTHISECYFVLKKLEGEHVAFIYSHRFNVAQLILRLNSIVRQCLLSSLGRKCSNIHYLISILISCATLNAGNKNFEIFLICGIYTLMHTYAHLCTTIYGKFEIPEIESKGK